MQIVQSRRHFLASMSVAGGRGRPWHPGIARRRGPAGDHHDPAGRSPGICVAPGYIAEDLLRAEGFTEIRYIPDYAVDAVARGEIDFDIETAAWVVSQRGCRRADHGVGGRACRLLRAVRARADPDHQRPQGKRVGIAVARLERASAPHGHGGAGRARSEDGHQVDRQPRPQASWSCSPKARSMHFSRSRPSRRSCAPARSVT